MTLQELIAAVPIREFRGRPFYVRISDIPPPWDAQFSRALYGAGCPGFEGEGRCAYSHDWENWVNGHWWGGADVPTGLVPSQHQIKYVCNAVKAVYGVTPDGLSDVVVAALKVGGKLSLPERERLGRKIEPHILELIEKCAQAAKRLVK